MPRKSPAQATPTISSDPEWLTDAIKDLPPILKIAEVSAVVKISVRQLRRDIAAGKIACLKDGEVGSSRVLIPRREVARFLLGMAR